ncbi:MAG: helix-turn-helix domain-containing protein [Woeseiaceae bacterium]|nr:helix-turn-helix domain-containing protein [Woeseiaceae bacterium]
MYKRAFIHELREAVEDAAIPASHALLLLIMANYANSEGGSVRPSQVRLAKGCKAGERSVRRYIAHLKEAGWLEVTKQGSSGEGRGGVRHANEYRLHVGRNFKLTKGGVEFPESDDNVVALPPRREGRVKSASSPAERSDETPDHEYDFEPTFDIDEAMAATVEHEEF